MHKLFQSQVLSPAEQISPTHRRERASPDHPSGTLSRRSRRYRMLTGDFRPVAAPPGLLTSSVHVPRGTRAENIRADTHQCRAFGHSLLKISGHAHGQMGQCAPQTALQVIPQTA